MLVCALAGIATAAAVTGQPQAEVRRETDMRISLGSDVRPLHTIGGALAIQAQPARLASHNSGEWAPEPHHSDEARHAVPVRGPLPASRQTETRVAETTNASVGLLIAGSRIGFEGDTGAAPPAR